MKINNIKKTYSKELFQPVITCDIEITAEQMEQMEDAMKMYGDNEIFLIVGKELIERLKAA